MEADGIAYRVLDGAAAAADEEDLLALADEVRAAGREAAGGRRGRPPAGEDRARRARVRRRQPGFTLIEARHGQYLVGCASGMPLRASTSWWRGLTAPLPGQVTAEHPGRTFAVTGLAVRPSWRRQGIGRELHRLLLAERPEERATLTVAPGAAAAQAALRSWGWRKVARTRGDDGAGPVLDLLLIGLPWAPAAARDQDGLRSRRFPGFLPHPFGRGSPVLTS